MKGQFIVIEGLDGSGKSTQIELLRNKFDAEGVPYRYIHFPMLDRGRYGELIAEFLRGEYGAIDEVHPKLVALLFANDRKEHVECIHEWLAQGYAVLADRYVYSNIAFQCAKLDSEAEKEALKRWILDFEFTYNGLPRPTRSFFLDVPFEAVARSLSHSREGEDRRYLRGKEDIHESSLMFQRKVYEEYKKMVTEIGDLVAVSCYDGAGEWLGAGEVHGRILEGMG